MKTIDEQIEGFCRKLNSIHDIKTVVDEPTHAMLQDHVRQAILTAEKRERERIVSVLRKMEPDPRLSKPRSAQEMATFFDQANILKAAITNITK